MNSAMVLLGKWWLDLWGRNKTSVRYPFPDTGVVSPGMPLKVRLLWKAAYLNLHPTHYAVAVTPDGRAINLRGGYNPGLNPGRYTFHYVDKQSRVFAMPRITGTTRDGAQVALDLIVTFKVIDPIKALDVQQPADTLLSFITSDVKEFIRCHDHDDIIGDETGRKIDNDEIVRYIKGQHGSRFPISKLFLIENIVIDEKIGDPQWTEIRGSFQVQQRQNIVATELQAQNQELQKKIASKEAEIQQIKVQSEADQQAIQQKMKMRNMELERAKAELEYRQEIMMKAMEAIGQAFSASSYPMDPREVEIIKEIIGEFREQTGSAASTKETQQSSAPPKPSGTTPSDRIGTLTDTLLSLLNYKRR